MASAACTSALTLFLVRSLGKSGYGVYALAASVGGLALLPAGMGLPTAVGRFLAEHRDNVGGSRAIFALGLKVQAPVALAAAVALILLAGPIAAGYGDPHLVWPVRWMGFAVAGQSLFGLLTSTCTSLRRVSASLWMVIVESTTEVAAATALVVVGAGAAGALLGRAIGYAVAVAAGLYLTVQILGGRERRGALPAGVNRRSILSYSGALLVVDAAWSAIARVDVLLIGAILTSAAVGSFSAVLRILTLLGYMGMAVSGGVAPRVARAGRHTDVRSFNEAIRYLLLVQGLVIAPMLVWAKPITGLLLGAGYASAAPVMRILAVQAFVSAPASLISVAVSYLGEGRRRVVIMLATLAFGLILTYVLLKTLGLAGAAAADDLVAIVYVGAHLWLCGRLITLETRRLMWSTLRVLIAAAAMGLPLLGAGVEELSPAGWVLGGLAGVLVYVAVLLAIRELSIAELRAIGARLGSVLRPERG